MRVDKRQIDADTLTLIHHSAAGARIALHLHPLPDPSSRTLYATHYLNKQLVDHCWRSAVNINTALGTVEGSTRYKAVQVYSNATDQGRNHEAQFRRWVH
jgi:hypothetical protein